MEDSLGSSGGFPGGLSKSRSYNDNTTLEDSNASPRDQEIYADSEITGSSTNVATDGIDFEFNAHMVLEPSLRPTQPDMANVQSMQLFKSHRFLAQEYLKMQTELALLMERRQELERVDLDSGPQSLNEYERLRRDKYELEVFKGNLMDQLGSLKKRQRQKEAIKDGDWVLVDQNL